MTPDTREKLMNVSVATLATALYKRGLRNQVVQGVGPVARKGRWTAARTPAQPVQATS